MGNQKCDATDDNDPAGVMILMCHPCFAGDTKSVVKVGPPLTKLSVPRMNKYAQLTRLDRVLNSFM